MAEPPADAIEDVLGIGFGPANIALAVAAAEDAPGLRCRFLEARRRAEWQPGMLLGGSDIQNNPIRDLATLRNPRSRYTFINFLHEQGRLLTFLNVPLHFPLRKDYARYIQWVAEQFTDVVDYGSRAVDVRTAAAPVPHYVVRTETGRAYRGRALVVGTGRTPFVPEIFIPHLGERLFHSTEYLWRRAELESQGPLRTVAVIGASQSAAEIALDLHSTRPECTIVNIMRGFGPRLKDTSPFSEEAFLPEFTDYYFDASPESKADLDAQLRATNYSSVDGDVIEALYVRRYEDALDGRRRLQLARNNEITGVSVAGEQVELRLRERHTGKAQTVAAEAVVLATGFQDLGRPPRGQPYPALLSSLAAELATDEHGTLKVERDYFVPPVSTDAPSSPLFLNGLCESSHGLGDAGSFSLLSLRAHALLTGIAKRLDPLCPRG